MAHLVEQMAYVDRVPWHGLGFKMPTNSTIEDWQERAGLKWSVKKKPVLYNETAHDRLRIFKDMFVLVRDLDQHPFAVVSERYKPVQPSEVLEFYRDLAVMYDMKIETAGSLKNGARIWALAKTGHVHQVLGRDRVDGYLLLATSYDTTFSTLAQFTSVRVVCNNTLELSFSNNTGRITIPHSQTFDAKAVKDQMGIGKDAWEAFTKTADLLARYKMDTYQAEAFVHKLFNVDLTVDPMLPDMLMNLHHATNVLHMFSSPAPAARMAGQTAWGVLNSVSGYVDHIKRARGDAGRLNSAWFGPGAALKRKAALGLQALFA